jgi:hypothetical protein
MWLKVIVFLFFGTTLVWPCWADEGPLHVKNNFPLHLLFLTPRPDSYQLPEPGEITGLAAVDYSAVYFQHVNSRWDVLIDMELTFFEANLSYGISPNLALNFDGRMANMSGGFLDGFLQRYHDTLGVPNYGRERRPDNQFAYRITKDGKTWIDTEPGQWRIADSVVALLYCPPWTLLPGNPRQSLVANAKLPLGKPDEGTGSGRLDYGISWMAVWEFAPWTIYMMPGATYITDPKTDGADIRTNPSYSLFLGLAYRWDDRWRMLLQLNGYTSPIENSGIDELDNPAVELALGFQYRLAARWSLEFAFCEDLTRAVPDFTVHLSVQRHFGR